MLRQGKRLAAAQRLRNIAFLVGDVTALPWTADQFDLVVCRQAEPSQAGQNGTGRGRGA